MFEYLKGQIVDINPTYIVVDVAGVGYRLLFANPYKLEVGKTVQLYVEQIIRENEQSLYGFSNIEDKMLFQKLIGVSGIGPKSALAILAASNVKGLAQAVQTGDVEYLQSFPGIGKKTAQQIVLDLKGKLDSADQEFTVNDNHQFNDALAALSALGYSKKDIAKIEDQLNEADLSTDQYISLGLKLLSR